jgi:hypothetical protein
MRLRACPDVVFLLSGAYSRSRASSPHGSYLGLRFQPLAPTPVFKKIVKPSTAWFNQPRPAPVVETFVKYNQDG